MKKIAFVFSGQGAQYTGMGKELFDNFLTVKELYNRGSEILERDLKDISFYLDIKALSETINSQPAIFTLSLASYLVLKENGIVPASAAGFSLGECCALTAGECVSIDDGFKIINIRSCVMQKASEESGGAMYAVLGLDEKTLINICDMAGGYCIPVNFNCPGQTVIAGENSAADEVAQNCLKAGAIKVVKLAVSAAFHSKLMEKAAEEFKNEISDIQFFPPIFPLYSDITGKIITDYSNMPEYLKNQIISPVLWITIIENMINDGITDFVELGPGKTLCGLIRKISRNVNVHNVEDMKSFKETLTALR